MLLTVFCIAGHAAPEHEKAMPGSGMMAGSMNHMTHAAAGTARYADRKNAVTMKSESGNYRISLFSDVSPIPVKKMHTWTVHVENMSGAPFESGRLYVNGGMPMHRHDFPTMPIVKEYLGNGDYKVEGIKFNMFGHWEMGFNIQSGRETDYVVFKINLQPGGNLVNQQWSEQELSRIRDLWIGNLSELPSASPTNRVADNALAAELGQKIFFDKRFSVNGQVACATCHNPDLYFTDGLAVAQGVGVVERNAPTVVGASFNTWFFRDGRADSLWSQALGPLEDRQEHGGSRNQYAHIIYNDPDYRSRYEELFGALPDLSNQTRFPDQAGPVFDKTFLRAWKSMTEIDRKVVTTVFVNFAKAVAAYERLLKPGPSRFDQYVKAMIENDNEKMNQSMSADEVAGLKLFVSKANCTMCHNGPLFSDLIFHNIATPPVSTRLYDWGRYKGVRHVKKSEFNCRGAYNDAKNRECPELDYVVFHKEDTAAAFKTPGLRNVSKTAPYMHAGQYKTLAEVIGHYAKPPATKVGISDLLAITLNKSEQKQLEAFLLTLDSPIDADPRLLAPL